MQSIHPYTLLSQREIDACQALALAGLRAWQAGWCPDSAIGVSCTDATGLGASTEDWAAYGNSAETAIWVRREEGFDKQFGRLLFNLDQAERSGERRESDIADNVATQAYADLIATVLAHLSPAQNAAPLLQSGVPPTWLLRRHAGTAVLHVSCNGKALVFLVPHTRLQPRPKRANAAPQSNRPELATLSSALTACEARLVAQLGAVEISLGELKMLAVGDIVKLPVGLDQPLAVLTETGRHIGQAYLGKQQNNRAVEIFAAPKT